MIADKPKTTSKPMWYYTKHGDVIKGDKGFKDAKYWCREGDKEWTKIIEVGEIKTPTVAPIETGESPI